ncbi:MAG: hypothetical protein AAGK04_06470 [Planctomycetota bacterium]
MIRTTMLMIVLAFVSQPAARAQTGLGLSPSIPDETRGSISTPMPQAAGDDEPADPESDPRFYPAPPLVTTPEWQGWYFSLLARRLAECPRGRSRSVYFAADGSDVTGDGTMQNPYLTIARADAQLDSAHTQDVALLFKRGDVFRSQTGITVDRPNVTIADWGDPSLPKPLLTPFESYDAAGWGYIFGTRASGRRETEPVKWVRDTDDPDRHFIRASTPQKVLDCPGTWHWNEDSQTLYVHPIPEADGTVPDLRLGHRIIERVTETESGVLVSADNVRLENLRLHGWGMNGGPRPSQKHGIDLSVRNSQRAVAVNCESYYGSSHAMVHVASGASGGIATFVDCKAGLTTYNTGTETIFNTYAQGGQNQVIFHRCSATHGTLPSENFAHATERRGRAFYAHTGGSDTPSDLVIVHDAHIPAGPRSCSNFAVIADAPPADTLADVRAFVVNERFEGGQGTGIGGQFLVPRMARVNGAYLDIRPPHYASNLITAPADGWAINCAIEIDLVDVTTALFAITNGRDDWAFRGRLWHCSIHVRSKSYQEFRLDYDTPHRSEGMSLVNTVLVNLGSGAARAFVGAPMPESTSLFAAGFDPASLPPMTEIAPDELPAPMAQPADPSELRFGAQPIPELAPLRFDLAGADEPRSTVGPIQAKLAASLDIDGNNRLDIEDLHDWHRQPIDLNGDRVVDDLDRRRLERALRWGESLGWR